MTDDEKAAFAPPSVTDNVKMSPMDSSGSASNLVTISTDPFSMRAKSESQLESRTCVDRWLSGWQKEVREDLCM